MDFDGPDLFHDFLNSFFGHINSKFVNLPYQIPRYNSGQLIFFICRTYENLTWIDTMGFDDPDIDDNETFQDMLRYLHRQNLVRNLCFLFPLALVLSLSSRQLFKEITSLLIWVKILPYFTEMMIFSPYTSFWLFHDDFRAREREEKGTTNSAP